MKSHDDILDALLEGCEMEVSDKRRVKRSALGPKFQFHQGEKDMFTGQGLQLAAANESSRIDLDRIGADEWYAEKIQAEAIEHSLRESNPEDLQTAQLRELVAMAEGDIVEMQDRLFKCQGSVKFSMRSMARQLQSVEKLVHISLQELKLIAESAGVPDKKEPVIRMPGTAMANTATSFGSSNGANERSSAKMKVLRHLGAQEGVVEAPVRPPTLSSKHRSQRPAKGTLLRPTASAEVQSWHMAGSRVEQFSRGLQMGNGATKIGS